MLARLRILNLPFSYAGNVMLVNIISSFKGGGAELLVRELHRVYLGYGMDVHAVYLDGNAESLGGK